MQEFENFLPIIQQEHKNGLLRIQKGVDMSLIERIGEIEVYEIDKDLSRYTRKEREEIINEMFKQEYQGKEIHYLLNEKEISAVINASTRKYFFAKQHSDISREKESERNKRIDLVYSSGFINVISNAKYSSSKNEYKVGQNSKHKENTIWRYFKKKIIFNNESYLLIISVRESCNRFYIHNTRIKDTKEKRDARSDDQSN